LILAAANLIQKLSDHPWPGCRVSVFGLKLTLMSNGIAAMLLAAAILLAAVLPLARRWRSVPRGGVNVLELIVVFIRDTIARPALHDKADAFLPLLLTAFVFILTVNLVGILPLEPLSELVGLPKIGGVATSIPSVCGALACITLFTIIGGGLKTQALHLHHHRGWPMLLCAILSPVTWLRSLGPSIPGLAGKLLTVPLALLEFVGVLAKCMALMIRLFANMLSGHALLAVIMMFIVQAAEQQVVRVLYVGPFCIAASVVVDLMELLVAGLQAYIFTFLTATFLGLYVEPAH
jgi:F-type H+-transporting ATPase subunit a